MKYVRNVDRGEWEAIPNWITFLFLGALAGPSGLFFWGIWLLIRHYHGGR